MVDMVRAVIAPFEIDVLDRDTATICALDEDLRIAYMNPAWARFAKDNGGHWEEARWLGASFIDALPTSLRPFYEDFIKGVRETQAPADHMYECSTPALFRSFRLRVFPTERSGLLMTHTLSLETKHSRLPAPALEARFRSANGTVTQCCHCRRHERADVANAQWDWVPEYVERMLPGTSHGLCPLCELYFYPA